MATITKVIRPYEILIRFDHETGAFKGACFYGIETTTIDGVAQPPRETQAVPLDLAVGGPYGRAISQVLGEFQAQLTAETTRLQEEKAQAERDLEEKENIRVAIEQEKTTLETTRDQLVQTVRNEQAARALAEQRLADYEQADRVQAIIATREATAATEAEPVA